MKAHIKDNNKLTPEEELKTKQIALKSFMYDLVNENLDTDFPQQVLKEFDSVINDIFVNNESLKSLDDTLGKILVFEILRQGLAKHLDDIYFNTNPDEIMDKLNALAYENEKQHQDS